LLEERLLTLTGVGGCGKTRLALKLAESVLHDFPDGVWFVELASVTDGARVLQVIAGVMGVREVPGTPLSETLYHHIAGMRTLVFFDNCEHLLAEVGSIAAHLLQVSPELRVLATSREGLGVDGEIAYTVRSMTTPDMNSLNNLQAVEDSEAVQLFVDRARLVAREFALTESSAPAVADICRHLDGIPLAIELAAARVEVLSVEQIRSKLKDRFRLLTGGNRALPRHQTLRATIQWSYDHLTQEEQRLFRFVSVFSGGWSLAGATAVAGEVTTEFELLDQLTSLVRKSLVEVERETMGEVRYRMLETVRQYAQERLNESGEGDTGRTRHFDFFLSLAEDLEHELHGPKQVDYLRQLDQDLENVLSAHAWCDSVEGSGERGLRLVWALQRYWQIRGLFEAGFRMCRHALDREGADGRSRDRMRVLSTVGQMAYFIGRFDEARELLKECLSIAQELGEKGPAAAALTVLGGVVYAQGDAAAAHAYLKSALKVARESGYKQRITASLTSLAEVHRAEGNFDEAAPLYAESIALGREMEDKDIISLNLINLSMVLVDRGELDGARALLVEGLATAEKVGAKKTVQMAIDAEAGLLGALREWHRAARLMGASEAQMVRMGCQRESADERFIAPRIAQARKELGEEAYGAMCAAGRALSYEEAVVQAKEWLEENGPR
jgi:predicted ATPase